MAELEYHQTIIVGAGPGGLATANYLRERGIGDVQVVDRGVPGQTWLEYPLGTRLLTESGAENDENMIAGIKLWESEPNISHPTHLMYQKYLALVSQKKLVHFKGGVDISHVEFDSHAQRFLLQTADSKMLSCDFLIWSAGTYATPNELIESEGCYIHYSRIQDWRHITDESVCVVGGANGASDVVIQLAKPGRKVRIICSGVFEVPEAQDDLWQQNRTLVKHLANQGLVEIVENFRVKKISRVGAEFVLESNDNKILKSPSAPILCIGFLPNIEPVHSLVDLVHVSHEVFLQLDASHQSKKTPKLYFAGILGRTSEDQQFIKDFRDFGESISASIQASATPTNAHDR